MTQLLVADAPGGLGDVYKCPFCSLYMPTRRRDDQGNLTEELAEPPRVCTRCKSPMDVDGEVSVDERWTNKGSADKPIFELSNKGSAAQKFEDAKAIEASKDAPRSTRRLVKV